MPNSDFDGRDGRIKSGKAVQDVNESGSSKSEPERI
jgi:hypothetical protein